MDVDDPLTQPEPFLRVDVRPLPQIPPAPILPIFLGPQRIWFPPLLGPEGDPVDLPAHAWRDPRKRRNTPPSPPPRPASWLSWARDGLENLS